MKAVLNYLTVQNHVCGRRTNKIIRCTLFVNFIFNYNYNLTLIINFLYFYIESPPQFLYFFMFYFFWYLTSLYIVNSPILCLFPSRASPRKKMTRYTRNMCFVRCLFWSIKLDSGASSFSEQVNKSAWNICLIFMKLVSKCRFRQLTNII